MLGQYTAYPQAVPGAQPQPVQMQPGYAAVPGQLFYILINFATFGRDTVSSLFRAVFGRPLQVTVRPMLGDHCPVCPICNVGVLWPSGWMEQGATCYAGRPHPRRHCVRWEPSPPCKGSHQLLPTFRPTSIVAKRSPISATDELFFV